MEQRENVEVIFVNGLAVDPETGEVLGLEIEHEQRLPFHIHDLSSAEWFLEKLQEEELDLAALEARVAILLENTKRLRAQKQKRVDWLRMRFVPELREWARAELAGKKQRSIATVFGRISFRKVPAKLKVVDEQEALRWAKEFVPKAVKTTEHFLVSEVPSSLVVVPDGCELLPESESFRVDTGASKL